MKTSLQHLPMGKQNEILAITEIIRTALAPEKIVLFGSYAKGNYKEHEYISKGIRYEYISDYDFLIVTKNDVTQTTNFKSDVQNKIDRYKPPVNLEIHGIDYINEGLGWGQYFFTDIIKEGILLYDTGLVNFAEPRILTPQEKRDKAQRYFDLWFPKARPFINGSRFFYSDGSYK